MIKNKDGTYNKLSILILSCIIIFSIISLSIYISQNVNLPKIDPPKIEIPIPQPTPQETPIPSETIIPITISNDQINITNWSWMNATHNFTYVTSAYGGSGGAGGQYWILPEQPNTTYIIVGAGGAGGSAAVYQSQESTITQTQVTQTPQPTQTSILQEAASNSNVTQVVTEMVNILSFNNNSLYLMMFLGFFIFIPLFFSSSHHKLNLIFSIMLTMGLLYMLNLLTPFIIMVGIGMFIILMMFELMD
jgi:hypothetical protein